MDSLNPKFYILYSHRRGQGALALAFLVGGTAVLAALALAFFAVSFTNTIYGFQASNRALAAASAGASDALRELTRDMRFSMGSYTVPVGSIAATVKVDNDFAGTAKITSEVSSFGFKRKLEVAVSINQQTGEVAVLSWRQVPI